MCVIQKAPCGIGLMVSMMKGSLCNAVQHVATVKQKYNCLSDNVYFDLKCVLPFLYVSFCPSFAISMDKRHQIESQCQ